MLKCFYPNKYMDSTYSIDFNEYYKKGYRGILFDIDNTLVPHGFDADEKAINLISNLREIGFKICFISNNKEERVKRFNKEIGAEYIYKANKPLTKNYINAMSILGTEAENTLFVGDQLFTDVYGAKKAGLFSILVKPIDPHEEIQIVLKRYLERIVLHFYKKSI